MDDATRQINMCLQRRQVMENKYELNSHQQLKSYRVWNWKQNKVSDNLKSEPNVKRALDY